MSSDSVRARPWHEYVVVTITWAGMTAFGPKNGYPYACQRQLSAAWGGGLERYHGSGYSARRQVAGAVPNAFLKARENAASDS